MRITESQLRRIIRQEVRALRESPVDHAAATRGMSSRERANYWKKENERLLGIQRASASSATAMGGRSPSLAEPFVSRGGSVPTITGGRGRDHEVAQAALADWHSGMDAAKVVEFIVDETAKYEKGYVPKGSFSDRDHIVGDRGTEVIALIRDVDPEAADDLEMALSDFQGF
jgi:hypothetical protein